MQETINQMRFLTDMNWRGNAYQWFFYSGILLTLILEKRKMVRIVFGWVPLVFLAVLYNPLILKLMHWAHLSNLAYITRLFSFMPLMYVIARGFSLMLNLLQRVGNEWVKLAGVCTICSVICLTGHNIYEEDWLTKGKNYEKVPQDTLEILEAVRGEGDDPVRIAPIDGTAVYIRQIEDVITPYGRIIGELGNQLSADPPDVRLAMEMAGSQDTDYVVVHNTDVTLAAFAENGYEPYALTNNYAIFKVEGVARTRRVLNDNRQVVTKTYYNEFGEPTSCDLGYTTVAFEYDNDGRNIKESYFDASSKPYYRYDAFCAIGRTLYKNSLPKTITYLDENDVPVLYNGRYRTKYKYNGSGQISWEAYYDVEWNPMNRLDGKYAQKSVSYYPSGNIAIEQYFDQEGHAVLSTWGYAGLGMEYDDALRLKGVTYYDTNNKIIGKVGEEEPDKQVLMDGFIRFSDHTMRDNSNSIVFETSKPGNRFSKVLFQIWDIQTGNYLMGFAESDEEGLASGTFVNPLPSGLYSLAFKANTNLKDESFSSYEYLREGETLYYKYRVDEIQDQRVAISDFYIGRAKQ